MSLSIFLRTFALSRPVIAAYLPPLSHALHVFARPASSTGWADVKVGKRASVAVLVAAVIGELQLGVPPSRVRLLREVDDGGAPVALDSLKKLAEQGVGEGTRVVAEVMREWVGLPCLIFQSSPALTPPAPPSLSPPLMHELLQHDPLY